MEWNEGLRILKARLQLLKSQLSFLEGRVREIEHRPRPFFDPHGIVGNPNAERKKLRYYQITGLNIIKHIQEIREWVGEGKRIR
jgi:hypothetical protein